MNRTERKHAIGWCREYLERIEKDAEKLADLAKAGRPDGYPSSSLGGSGSPGTISDRTGTVAVQLAEPDHQRQQNHAEQVFKSLQSALQALESADKARRLAFPPNVITRPDVLVGCKSHARLKDHHGHALFEPPAFNKSYEAQYGKPRARAGEASGLCQTCYEWSLAHHGNWPSPWLLERLRDGARLTTKLAEEAELRERKAS